MELQHGGDGFEQAQLDQCTRVGASELSGRDRRRSRRATLFSEVCYEGACIQTRISDIALHGVFIDTMSPLPVGKNLRMSFSLPGGHLVKAEGVVIHRQMGIGMGVQFTRLEPEDARLIQDTIDLD